MTRKARFWIAASLAGTAAMVVFAAARISGGVSTARSSQAEVPQLALPDLNGKMWKLSDHAGSVVLVDFWATWCPPCRYETPDLVEVYRRYEARAFTAVGISLDEDGPDEVRQFAAKYNIPYPILLPGESGVGSAIEALPTTLLIDKKGRLARTYSGMVDRVVLSRDIERLLAE